EQHYVPGGCCTSFSRKGFRFDAGVLHLTGGKESGAFQRVLSTLEMEDELEFKEQFQRFVFPDLYLDSTRDLEYLPEKLKELFPQEAEGITGLFSVIRSMYEDVTKLPRLSPLLTKYREKSIQELVDEYVKDPKLKALVNANWHLWNPAWKNSAIDYTALLITEQLRGYFYPLGGIQAVPDAFVRVLERYGGEIELRTFVDRIILEEGKAAGVETQKGKRIRASQVVSNAAARATFLNMVGEGNLPKGFVASLNQLEISLSAFYVYLGVDIDPRAAGIEAPETIVYETYDNTEEWELLLQGEVSIPCFGIAVPTFLDAGLAPPGKHVVIIMTMAPYHLMGKSWKEEKKRMTDKLVAKAEQLIPNLSQHIIVQDSATPLTYERYTLNSLGAAMGWALSPQMFLKRLEQRTPIPNLYLAGHWAMPGGGVPAVAISGMRAARIILGE
ncbi:MAG TPA: NAD(P)/FAD-dependent oxidoreductase, partial [Dehalococcoidia bacterium]|nr:NAD(P)/FAD-dependent oxidoreductase [Dehalococcoidia bacterium]